MIQWFEWCHPSPPTAMLLTLSGSRSTLRLRIREDGYATIPRCDGPGLRTSIDISRWVPNPLATVHLPLRAEFVGPKYRQGQGWEVHYRVEPGHVFNYAVALVNTSRKSFRFGRRCPIYEEQVYTSTPPFDYVLNCHAAGTIKPGGSAVFSMRIPTPLRTSGSIEWRLQRDSNGTFIATIVYVGRVPAVPLPVKHSRSKK